MRVPIRKAGRYGQIAPDRHITLAKYNELKKHLAKLLATRPGAIAEMQKHAFDGDFSENAPYQIAKGRLRGLNQKILELEEALKYAEIIAPGSSSANVQIGSTVTVELAGQTKTYQILGSSETDPSAGIISHRSPFGVALLNHYPGDTVIIKVGNREIPCRIIKIN